MAHWMRVGSRSRTRFQELVKPFAVVLHTFDEDAKKEQFIEEDLREQVHYENMAARLLDALGPAMERMIKAELIEHPDLLRPRR